MRSKYFKDWLKEIRKIWKPLVLAIIFFTFSSIITLPASLYVDEKIPVVHSPDLILDNIPVIDLLPLFIILPYLMIIIAFVYIFFIETKRAPCLIMGVGFLYFIRAIFITLTHLSTPAGAIYVPTPFFDNDVFFSGHASLPVLLFFMFRNKWMKITMAVFTIVLSLTVLLMHRHYSIDVLAGWFIAFSIYKLNNVICKKLNWGS